MLKWNEEFIYDIPMPIRKSLSTILAPSLDCSTFITCESRYQPRICRNFSACYLEFFVHGNNVLVFLGMTPLSYLHCPTVQFSNLEDFYIYFTLILLSKINLYHRFKLWSRSAKFSDDLQIWNGQIVQNWVLFHLSSCEDCFHSWNCQFRL